MWLKRHSDSGLPDFNKARAPNPAPPPQGLSALPDALRLPKEPRCGLCSGQMERRGNMQLEGRGCGHVEVIPGGGTFKGKGLEVKQLHLS